MRTLTYAIALGMLISVGAVAAPFGRGGQSVSFRTTENILKAHHFFQEGNLITDWAADATKWTVYRHGKSPGYFERRVSVARAGGAFRRYKTDPQMVRQQVDLFDGISSSRFVVESGKLIEEGAPIAYSQFEAVESGVNTFGLIPILQQLADPLTVASYSGRAIQGEDIFNVRTAKSSWLVYVDERGLIRRIEMQGKAFEYGDYHLVEGIWLPFTQRMFVKGQLFYVLFFTRIDLTPKSLTSDFQSEVLPKELRH
jgi:hypothetical protein